MPLKRARVVLLPLACLLAALQGEAAVSLTRSDEEVVLDNGRLRAVIAARDGDLRSLSLDGREAFAEPAYLDWHTGRTNHLSRPNVEVVRAPDGSETAPVEIAFKQTWSGKPGEPALDVALHYVLLPGETGLRMFAVFGHPASYPDSGFGQTRFVMRVRDELFDTISVDEKRTRLMPPNGTPTKAVGPKESMQFLEGPFKGEITDKYHYFTDAGDHFFHGWLGSTSGLGCWVVQGSNEDQNGGPTKQHNTAHFGRVLLKILGCGHYGAAGVELKAGQAWEKLYGPWMVLLNTGADTKALRADAARAAEAERAAFPPAWLRHTAFPSAAERGGAVGRINLLDTTRPGAKATGAWVGLAAAAPDWQQQSLGYQSWVRADAEGRFELKAVRPGRYTLYAFTDGVLGEFRRDDVEITAGARLDLRDLDWAPPCRGRVLWQLGTPDRTAAEFRHGDDHRRWGLWNQYAKDFPDDVHFVLGKSDPRTDWNFAHGTRLAADGKTWEGTTWTLSFEVPKSQASYGADAEALLRFAFAAAHNAELVVSLDGKPLGTRRKLGSDNALARAGIHGQYETWDLPFPAALLTPGTHTLSLRQASGGAPFRNVMYDCIRLEVP